MEFIKIKLTALSLLLVLLSACAFTATKKNETLQLMDGSNLVIKNNKVVKITDKTGEIVSIKKGAMLELTNGNYIYIRLDGTVKKIEINDSSSSHGGHSHSH
jgi:hypothetical protein